MIPTPQLRDSNFNVDRLNVEGQEAVGITAYNSGSNNKKGFIINCKLKLT